MPEVYTRRQASHPARRTLKDATGKSFGPDLCAAAQKPEGQITEVCYMWPRTGSDKTPVAKVSFVTKVGDLASVFAAWSRTPHSPMGDGRFPPPLSIEETHHP
jgi:hypothetical protein